MISLGYLIDRSMITAISRPQGNFVGTDRMGQPLAPFDSSIYPLFIMLVGSSCTAACQAR